MKDSKIITIQAYNKIVQQYICNTKNLYPAGIDTFMRLVEKGGRILDMGCGWGKDAKILVQAGFSVLGIDLSPEMIMAAKNYAPEVKFQIMDIENMDVSVADYDGVWANASLLHISKEKIKLVLRKINEILKDDGIFYLSLKQGEGEVVKRDQRYGTVDKFWSFFSKNEIEEILINCGFTIIEVITEDIGNNYQTHKWMHLYVQKPSHQD